MNASRIMELASQISENTARINKVYDGHLEELVYRKLIEMAAGAAYRDEHPRQEDEEY